MSIVHRHIADALHAGPAASEEHKDLVALSGRVVQHIDAFRTLPDDSSSGFPPNEIILYVTREEARDLAAQLLTATE